MWNQHISSCYCDGSKLRFLICPAFKNKKYMAVCARTAFSVEPSHRELLMNCYCGDSTAEPAYKQLLL